MRETFYRDWVLKMQKHILLGKHPLGTFCRDILSLPSVLKEPRKRRQKKKKNPLSSILHLSILSFPDILKTWISFIFFPLKGFLIYFTYGIRHSLEGHPREEDDDEEASSDSINAATKEKAAIQADDQHQRNLSLPFIFHEKTSEC